MFVAHIQRYIIYTLHFGRIRIEATTPRLKLIVSEVCVWNVASETNRI